MTTFWKLTFKTSVFFQQSRHQQRQTSLLQNEIDTLRSDNVKLYEKIRFLQSYPNKVSFELLSNIAVLLDIMKLAR